MDKIPKFYLGLTIGPIVKTLMTAQKTRSLWAASYTFAYLMKEIAKAFDEKHKSRDWYKPALGEVALEVFMDVDKRTNVALRETGVGLFPDNLILNSTSEQDVSDLRDIAKKVIKQFACDVAAALGREKETTEIEEYFLRYFQIYIVRKAIPSSGNPILEMSKLLSTMELQQAFAPVKKGYLTDFFNLRPSDDSERTFLTNDAFLDGDNIKSIPEIALTTHLQSEKILEDGKTCKDFVDEQLISARVAAKLEGINADDVPEQYVDWVKEFIRAYNKIEENKNDPIPFFTGQKYIAIVQADGDGIGKLLQSLPLDTLPEFSKKLTRFAADAAELVNTHNGLPVYFGGDDALFFAPVIEGDRNIFMLLRALNEKFGKCFKDFSDTKQSPTLSFGLSITHIKYPLYEALSHSGFLLRQVAKAGLVSDETDDSGQRKRLKNNIAFRVLKHSGSSFSGLIHLDSEKDFSVLEAFLEVFQENIDNPNDTLRSIIYRLPENKQLFNLIGRDKEALANFLDSSFDEAIHDENREYLSNVAALIHHCYEYWDHYVKAVDEETFESPNRMAYNLLKTIAFLTTTEEA